jgi:hypothetical protein
MDETHECVTSRNAAEARRYIKSKSRSLAPESGTRDDGAGAEKPQVSRPTYLEALARQCRDTWATKSDPPLETKGGAPVKAKGRSRVRESGTRDDGAGAEKPQVSRPTYLEALARQCRDTWATKCTQVDGVTRRTRRH